MKLKLALLLAIAAAFFSFGTGSAAAHATVHCWTTSADAPAWIAPLIYDNVHVTCNASGTWQAGDSYPIALKVTDTLHDGTYGGQLDVPTVGYEKNVSPYSLTSVPANGTWHWDQTWTTPCPDGRLINWSHSFYFYVKFHDYGSGNPGSGGGWTVVFLANGTQNTWSLSSLFACT